jgi:SAM-dependent methyltransferase
MRIQKEDLSDVSRYIQDHRNIPISEKEPHYRNLLAYVTPFIKLGPNLKMLEVGTGVGWFPILCKRDGLNCKGLEISQQLVEFAREYGRLHGVEPDIELGNIEETDLGEAQYDVIITSSVFEHVENWRLGLRNVYRALKPGGVLFFESTSKFSFTSGEFGFPLYGWLPNALRYRLRIWWQGPDIMTNGIDFTQFTYIGLRRAFRETGFSRFVDRLDFYHPEKIRNPLKKALVTACQKVKPLREIVLFFFDATTFVCIK